MPGMKTRCWEWMASSRNGYGNIWADGKVRLAHRTSWFLKHGRWPQLDLLHSCDNPGCVRLSHIREGTDADNMAERASKGRNADHKGEANGRAKLTAKEVTKMRQAYAKGGVLQRELAARFKTTQNRVSDILLRKLWDSVP